MSLHALAATVVVWKIVSFIVWHWVEGEIRQDEGDTHRRRANDGGCDSRGGDM
jgi:hypothetical protein